MNILVVAHYQNDGSPTASFIHDQIKAYCALGHNVRVLSPLAFGKKGYLSGSRIKGGKQTCNHVPHYYLRYLSLSSYGEKRFNAANAVTTLKLQLSAALEDFRPDVIHAHTLGFDSEIGAWLKQKLGIPLVVTTHGSDAAIPLQQGRTEQLRTACDKADRIIAVSSALKEKLRACGTSTSLDAIVNGFVPREVPENTARQPLRIIQVCNLIPLKRVDVTIRAFAALQKKHPDMELVIVGQGSQRSELEALCQALDIANNVRFLGQLPNEAVFRELCQSTFFVMASKPEGFGIVYLEAMAAGCVTIGTEGEGIADVIHSGENGFLVPADDPDAIVQVIEDCLADSQKAIALANAGQADARNLTWEENAKQYIRLFTELTLPK
ncbi:MAG: glycosyltransferase [Oscillospiraceae bacterium]|nr:glycosyltransferase [Oscillospiraceae bacterium]